MQFRRTSQGNTPGGLAAELGQAREQLDARQEQLRLAAEAAEAEFAAARADVIERGSQRIKEIQALQEELAQEQIALQEVVASPEK